MKLTLIKSVMTPFPHWIDASEPLLAARDILKDDDSAEALSLLAIIAVVQNEADTAVKSATQAVQKARELEILN